MMTELSQNTNEKKEEFVVRNEKSPEGLDKVFAGLGKDAGLKDVARTVANYIKESGSHDLSENLLAANLQDMVVAINKNGFVDTNVLDMIANKEAKTLVKDAIAHEYAFQIPAYKSIGDIEKALVEMNTIGFEFTTDPGGPTLDKIIKELTRVELAQSSGRKVLSSTIDALPEDFGLRATVKKIVGAGNILTN